MDFQSVLAAVLLALTLINGLRLLLATRSSKGKKVPPGPFPFPVFGNLHLLGKKPNASMARLAEKYGPVMTLKLGMVNTVVISSAAVAREALQKQDLAFSSRLPLDAFRANDQCHLSVVWLPVASQWRALRKVMNTNIFSGNKLDSNQHLRDKKIQELITYCQKNSQVGEAVDIGQAAFRTTLNLLSNTIFSRDLTDPYSDSAKEFKAVVWNMMVEAGKPNLIDYFPFLGTFDPHGIRRRMSGLFTTMLDLFHDLIDERLEEKKVKGTKYNDALDSLLNISQERPEEIDRTHILHLLLDLYAAGTDTTSNTFEWAMAELLKHPETMAKAQAELADVIGRGKPIHKADVTRLPYLQCVLKETFRLHPPISLIQRKVEQDVNLCGYTIPKGSRVIVNPWAIGRDPNSWENPLVFNPERFWNLNMDFKGQDFELIPFGAGRRICPGMPMAGRTLPVMLGSLLNTFQWKLEGDITADELDMEEKFGFTMAKARPLRAIPIPF